MGGPGVAGRMPAGTVVRGGHVGILGICQCSLCGEGVKLGFHLLGSSRERLEFSEAVDGSPKVGVCPLWPGNPEKAPRDVVLCASFLRGGEEVFAWGAVLWFSCCPSLLGTPLLSGRVVATEGRCFVVRKLLGLPHLVMCVPPPKPLGWTRLQGSHCPPRLQQLRTIEAPDAGRAPGACRLLEQGVGVLLGPTYHFLTVCVSWHSCVVISDHVN